MKIDLRRYDPEEREAALFESFSALSAGSSIHFVSDRDERHLLGLLESRRAVDFEWHLLAASEGLHEFVVERRELVRSVGSDITRRMQEEHAQIHQLVDRIVQAARQGNRERAAPLCEELRALLGAHIAMEERTLVPLVTERLASPRGPAAVLRDEHILIEALLERLDRSMRDSNTSIYELTRISADLKLLLSKHSAMEEAVLYEIVDLLMTAEERDELLRRWHDDTQV